MATRLAARETDLLLTVSHELRAPLASIRLAAGALVAGDVPESERDRLLQMIVREADHLSRLVGDLRAVTGPGLELRPCDAASLAHDVAEAAALRAPEGVAVEVDTVRGLSPVMADPDRLRQVLVNLVENALAHSPERGTVTLSIEAGPDRTRFAVSDGGLGVPEAERELVFKRLYGRSSGGSGLGLYVCRELVSRMDGRIWVEPREDAPGARFVFELPSA